MARIDPAVKDECPKCGKGPHDVPHFLHCPTADDPGEILTPDALWTMPVAAARHLGLPLEEE